MIGSDQISALAQIIPWLSAPGSLAGGGITFSIAVAILAGALRSLCAGIAKIRIAEAWKIWAGRCDPMNPHFQPPSIDSRPPKP